MSTIYFLVWQDGNTPLMCASGGGYVEIVEVLLQHYADVNMQNKYNVCMLLRMICICQLMYQIPWIVLA